MLDCLAAFLDNAFSFSGLNESKQRRVLKSVLQIVSTWVRIDKHKNLQIISALLPLEPGTRVHTRNIGCCALAPPPSQVEVEEGQVKMSQNLPTVLKLSFSCLHVQLVYLNLCFLEF